MLCACGVLQDQGSANDLPFVFQAFCFAMKRPVRPISHDLRYRRIEVFVLTQFKQQSGQNVAGCATTTVRSLEVRSDVFVYFESLLHG